MRLAKVFPCVGVAAFLVLPAVSAAADRPALGSERTNDVPRSSTASAVVQPADLNQLLQCLIGPGVEISNAVLTGAPEAAGTFSAGLVPFGIDQGIVLSSGNVVTAAGPNLLDDTSYDNGLPGDPDLDGLIPGYSTYDATVLEFDFECGETAVISFQYVFASEEYNEWVDSPFNDVFGFFLNGTNIATAPAACSGGGLPVSINNINCQNPYNPPGGPNCDCYRNNELSTRVQIIDTEMDGLTQVFFATATLQPGVNHIKLAIADAGDRVLDSNVLIRCQSFTCGEPPDIGACCVDDDDCYLLPYQQCVDEGGTWLGIGIPCGEPDNPCEDEPVPVVPRTWSSIKARHGSASDTP
jgi:hypothetical protein